MQRWTFAVLYLVAYVALEWAGNAQPVLRLGITPWNPQAGLTVAMLLLMGPHWAALAALAALAGGVLVQGTPAGWALQVAASVWMAGSYAVLALLLRGPFVAREALQALGPAVRFLLAAVLAALVAGAGYVACLLLAGSLPWPAVAGSIARQWIGDVNGILMLTPLLLLLARPRLPREALGIPASRAAWQVGLVQAVIVLLCVWLLFGLEVPEEQIIFYPLFVPMIWIAVRWGAVGALLAALVIQAGIVAALRDDAIVARAIDLQLLVLTLAVTGLFLGVAVVERARARSEALERDRQLSRAMRFAVAGEMASSLAHELNQPITALVSYLQASQIMSGPAATDSRLGQTLGKATREAIRAAEVLRRLRDFYTGTGPATSGATSAGPADVAGCSQSVLELLEPRLRQQGVRVRLALAAGLPQVAADRSQVEMVLHNLLGNAVDALAAGAAPERELLLEARADADTVLVVVHDSGAGVAEEALPQLFEPFNTTKSDGMGLGLAICRNLVRAQGGELVYRRSARLGGASFELRLPRFRLT